MKMTLLPGRGHASDRLRFVHLLLIGGGSALLFEMKPALATQSLQFQSGFLRQGPEYSSDAGALALKTLADTQDLAAGSYWVQIHVNQRYFGQRELRFDLDHEGKRLLPCLSGQLLDEMGLRLDSLAEPSHLQASCVDLLKLVPGSLIDFDGSQLNLAISIPQIAMRRTAIGDVDPELWDHGINAAFVSYQASAYQSSGRHFSNRTSDDLYLNSGINIGAWRLRSNQTVRQNADGKREWTRAYTYAQRDLPGTRANLTIGETYTGGDVFRSLPIKGALIKSDPEMLADALQGYAPVIRGVAQSRAKLEVLQNGYPIYSTYVSAGPYEIDDLTTVGNGELEIVLTEADGQVRRFTQPFATISNLLREGVWKYSSALGHYNAADNSEQPWLWQGTLASGIGWNSTVYGGLLAGDYYRAASAGIARDLGAAGAVAFDMTHSSADIDSREEAGVQGMSYALKYGKSFTTNTNLRFAGYRYSTEGYRDFDEAVRQRSRSNLFKGSRRSRLEASVYQKIGDRSGLSLTLTLSQQDYWGIAYEQRQFQFNFNTQHAGVTYNLYASQSLSATRDGETDRQVGLSVSLPLDFGHSSNASFDLQNSGERYSQRASLSNDDGRQQSAGFAMGYQGAFGSMGAGFTQGNDYRSTSVNASGAVLLHAGGIELGPNLGETIGLVEVPDVPGVGIQNAMGVQTNSRGFALVPYLRPYRYNHIALQTDQLGPEVEIDNGSAQVVPSRGAVVKTTFAARAVTRLVITGRTATGQPLPFGAQVSDGQGNLLGIVGQGGQILLSTSAQPQTLDVSWGEHAAPQCRLHIDPAGMRQAAGYRLEELTCN
jgi:outer membrane usher protein